MVGTIIISLEVELAWGVHHLPGDEGMDRHSPDGQVERESLDRLLSLCDNLDLPVSFDFVGHLLLEECEGTHPGPHRDDWFATDPGTDRNRDPLFYGPDLGNRVHDAAVDHEICTHTFSHVRCDEVSEDVVDWELTTAARTHTEFGLPAPTSFVPPVHGPPSLSTLADHGIEVVRRPVRYEPPVAPVSDSRLRRIAGAISRPYPLQVLFRRHPVRDPRWVENVVQTYSTWHTSLTAPFLPSGQGNVHPLFQRIPRGLRQRLHERYLRRGLNAAVDRDSHAHFWCHLFDLSNDVQWPPIRDFLQTLAEYRDAGDVRVVTMAALGNVD